MQMRQLANKMTELDKTQLTYTFIKPRKCFLDQLYSLKKRGLNPSDNKSEQYLPVQAYSLKRRGGS